MKWIVPGPNAKVVAQAIHCLAKLGEDLNIEGYQEKLCFRTCNMSKTVFATFSFFPDFFSFYPVLQDDATRCLISMKSALVVFRFPSGMERVVEHCGVVLRPEDDLVEFKIKFKQGFIKTNKIKLVDSQALYASYEDEVLPSRLVIEPKVLTDFLAGFQNKEITWAVSENGVQFRNFSELEDDGKGLRSEVYVSKEELLELSVASEAELTFCLAELKTVLNFAEHISCPITVSFSQSGAPMFFVVSNTTLTAHIVLATLGIPSSQSTASMSSSPVVAPRHTVTVLNDSQSSLSQSQASQGRIEVLRKVLKRSDFDISQLPGYDEVLAPDSDEEVDK